jgi:hypothetical protein
MQRLAKLSLIFLIPVGACCEPRGLAEGASDRDMASRGNDTTASSRVLREPRYVSQPLYARLSFSPSDAITVLLVLDKSSPRARAYDTLYADLNGNGDLTARAEKVVGKWDECKAPGGLGMEIRCPPLGSRFKNAAGVRLTVMTASKTGEVAPWVLVDPPTSGPLLFAGYPTTDGITCWGKAVSDAPIFRAFVPEPALFRLEHAVRLRRGKVNEIPLLVGSAGSVDDAFTAIHEEWLDASRDVVTATLEALSTEGAPLSVTWNIRQRC